VTGRRGDRAGLAARLSVHVHRDGDQVLPAAVVAYVGDLTRPALAGLGVGGPHEVALVQVVDRPRRAVRHPHLRARHETARLARLGGGTPVIGLGLGLLDLRSAKLWSNFYFHGLDKGVWAIHVNVSNPALNVLRIPHSASLNLDALFRPRVPHVPECINNLTISEIHGILPEEVGNARKKIMANVSNNFSPPAFRIGSALYGNHKQWITFPKRGILSQSFLAISKKCNIRPLVEHQSVSRTTFHDIHLQ
jgi:hypothetical protein